jgi:hypothetical protein
MQRCAIHGQYTITNSQPAAALSWGAVNNAPYINNTQPISIDLCNNQSS